MNILSEIWTLLCEMSPYLLLGFLLAGLMHEFIPGKVYTKYLGEPSLKSVVLAALFGVPLPLCSCGVIPTAMGIRKEGASKGATISFLIATPQTGVDSIFATYSLMGLPFAIIRPVVALLTAVFGGALCNCFTPTPSGRGEKVSRNATVLEGNSTLCKDERCANAYAESPSTRRGFGVRLLSALSYAFDEMMEDIGKWLAIGLIVAGIITAAVPDSWFTIFHGNTLFSILFVLLFSIPMYLCATGSIPIALALMLKGLTPGAALVLLMAGPASNAASILVVGKVLGKRSMLIYLISIITGAVLFGFGIDYLLPREWFTAPVAHYAACHEAGIGMFSYLCTALLLVLMARALWPWRRHQHHHEAGLTTGIIYNVEGMNCNHCAANVEKAIAAVEGVEHVEVSLHDGTASISGSASESDILQAVESIGFRASKASE
ncbi:MAG: SO_0444 family Cu/Zn efflux transporter [Bacteroidaceae bacterium]|nr:SO_0444 family Cu/Zn efflux transporter [Bacteroidaceae bacterium]